MSAINLEELMGRAAGPSGIASKFSVKVLKDFHKLAESRQDRDDMWVTLMTALTYVVAGVVSSIYETPNGRADAYKKLCTLAEVLCVGMTEDDSEV